MSELEQAPVSVKADIYAIFIIEVLNGLLKQHAEE